MPELKNPLPKYRLRKVSGQAMVTPQGHHHYLGKFRSPESEARYKQLVAGWANATDPPAEPPNANQASQSDLCVCELLAAHGHVTNTRRTAHGNPFLHNKCTFAGASAPSCGPIKVGNSPGCTP